MKKLLILTTFLSLIMTSMAHAKWTKVAENVNGYTYYVDLEGIKKHDGKVSFWELADYLKPTKYGVLSHKSYIEAECDRFRYRDLSATYYKSPMGEGTISFSNNSPEKEWNYPPPSSSSEIVFKAVCNHKPFLPPMRIVVPDR
jgi:hypothetical protein